jgi:hypothetical protein
MVPSFFNPPSLITIWDGANPIIRINKMKAPFLLTIAMAATLVAGNSANADGYNYIVMKHQQDNRTFVVLDSIVAAHPGWAVAKEYVHGEETRSFGRTPIQAGLTTDVRLPSHGSRSSNIMVLIYDESGNIHAQELIETKR